MMKTILATLLLCFATGVAAQEPAPAPPGGTHDEVGDAFARMDSDRDGQVTLEEFMKGIARPRGADREGVVYQRLPARFRELDADTDGYLDSGEYAALASRWEGAGTAPPMAEADRSGDGRVDFREFARLHVPPADDVQGDTAAR